MIIELYLVLVIFLLGLSFGSFANVCIWRIPQEELSIVKPRSFCPSCRKTIPWYYNIPVISFIALRGKCGFCKSSISFRYPAVELLTGFLFVAVYYRFGLSVTTLIYILLSLLLIIGSFVDIDHQILPPEITYTVIVTGVAFSFFNSFVQYSIVRSIIGLIVGGSVILLFRWGGRLLFKKEAMGLGDFKLMMGLGAYLGPIGVFWTIFIGSIFGSIIGITLKIVDKSGRFEYIPFGPFLAAGALFYVFIGRILNNIFFTF